MDSFISSIETWFEKINLDECQVYISRYPRDAIGVIRKFMALIPEGDTLRVYAAGGDGILFDCLNGVMGFDNAELAIMPYGMTNNFVRAFGKGGVPYFRDICYQAGGTAVPTDVISCKGRYALNFCTIGMVSDAVMRAIRINRVLEQGGRVLRRIYYGVYRQMYCLGDLLAAFNSTVTRQHYEINIDDEPVSGKFMNITIANGPYYEGGRRAAGAVPDDGLLDILISKSADSLKTCKFVCSGAMNRHQDYPAGFIVRRGKKISVKSDLPLFINLDGEVFFDNCFTAEVMPQAVKIISVLDYTYEGAFPKTRLVL
jgi:diacylglycerol kinase family enzyme